MKNFMNRLSYVTSGEDGASNVEIIVWISVVLIIAGVIYKFKDAILAFFGRATNRVDGLGVGNSTIGNNSTYDH